MQYNRYTCDDTVVAGFVTDYLEGGVAPRLGIGTVLAVMVNYGMVW